MTVILKKILNYQYLKKTTISIFRKEEVLKSMCLFFMYHTELFKILLLFVRVYSQAGPEYYIVKSKRLMCVAIFLHKILLVLYKE